MFWKMKKAILVVNRDKIQVLSNDSSQPSLFLFPTPVVHNLELIDLMGFEKTFQQFLEKESFTHTEFTIILDESCLFWKKLSPEGIESDFFDLIPLPPDQQAHKRTQVDGDIILSAHNNALLASVQRVLHNKKNIVVSILPFFAFPAFENGQVDLMNIDLTLIRRGCRYDSEILKFKSVGHHMSAPVLIGAISIAVMLMSGVGLYFWYFQQPKKVEKIIVKKIRKIPSPTPTIVFLDPKDISIDIKNGSGRFGEAGRLKANLEKEEYTISSVGNADIDSVTTEIATKIAVPHDYISSLSAILMEQYKMSSTSATIPESTSSADIIITIGIGRAQ